MAAGNPLNEELRQEILSVDGVTDIDQYDAFQPDVQKMGKQYSALDKMLP